MRARLIQGRVMRIGLVVLVIVLAGVGVAIAKSRDEHRSSRADCHGFRFDSKAWRADARHTARRRHQAKMLIACRTLRGMRRAKVRRLLGAPDDADDHGLSWEIGPDPLGIDAELLAVDFRHGHAVRVYEYQG